MTDKWNATGARRGELNQMAAATLKLLVYCREHDWSGYDPYDALNSRLFTVLPLLNRRLPRIVLTQALKRSPVNIRRLILIPETQNPKGLALFLAALIRMPEHVADRATLITSMVETLAALRSQNTQYWAWGYSFPWQTRTIIVPRGAPNLVCTTFVARALLDAYEVRGDERCLAMARSAAQYILEQLYWNDGGGACGFTYPLPSEKTPIHNANFLGAALLSRVYSITGETRLLDAALNVARYSGGRQRGDGSWPYGEKPTQSWIDNFHTGYNLCALREIGQYAHTAEFEECVRVGFQFYRTHFIRDDGAARYFHDKTYPVDVHCVAQGIITLLAFTDLHPEALGLARATFRWAMRHMWDDGGFFYYRVLRLGTIRTSYMRWSQAWMLLALSTFWMQQTTDLGESLPRTSTMSAR